MKTIGLDPGNVETAWVIVADGLPVEHGKGRNEDVLECVRSAFDLGAVLACEGIASYGMAVGKEVFDTCRWIGRFEEAWKFRGGNFHLVYRKDVKLFHCETSRANDANIRAALLDRFGPGREIAVGSKRSPGPLFGIKGDEWSALAVALTAEGKPMPPALFREPGRFTKDEVCAAFGVDPRMVRDADEKPF